MQRARMASTAVDVFDAADELLDNTWRMLDCVAVEY